MKYLKTRSSRRDELVQLLPLSNQDKLVSIVGCNRCDQVQLFFNDKTSEIFQLENLEESTMRAEPVKVLKKKGYFKVLKVKII